MKLVLPLLGVAALLAAGCGSGSEPEPEPPAVDSAVAAPAAGDDCDRSLSEAAKCLRQQDGRFDPMRLVNVPLCIGPDEGTAEKRLDGLTYEEAKNEIAGTPCSLRAIEHDGFAPSMTPEFVRTRINVVIRHGVIARVHGLH